MEMVFVDCVDRESNITSQKKRTRYPGHRASCIGFRTVTHRGDDGGIFGLRGRDERTELELMLRRKMTHAARLSTASPVFEVRAQLLPCTLLA